MNNFWASRNFNELLLELNISLKEKRREIGNLISPEKLEEGRIKTLKIFEEIIDSNFEEAKEELWKKQKARRELRERYRKRRKYIQKIRKEREIYNLIKTVRAVLEKKDINTIEEKLLESTIEAVRSAIYIADHRVKVKTESQVFILLQKFGKENLNRFLKIIEEHYGIDLS
jgi:hypothetical protein